MAKTTVTMAVSQSTPVASEDNLQVSIEAEQPPSANVTEGSLAATPKPNTPRSSSSTTENFHATTTDAMDSSHNSTEVHDLWPTTLIKEHQLQVKLSAHIPEPSALRHSSSRESGMKRTALRVKEHVKDYCSSTAIHGVRYIADDGQSHIEKIFWAVSIVVLMVGCFNRISSAWNKWETSPVIVTFAEFPVSITDVPFPAVTICPETKSRQTIFNYTEKYHRNNDSHRNKTTTLNITQLNDEELHKMEAVSLLCENQVFDGHRQLLLSDGAPYINQDTFQDLRKLAPDVQDAISFCQWQGNATNCSDIFKPIWSDEGLCFTFNLLRNIYTEAAVQYAQQDTSNLQEQETRLFHAVHAGPQAGLFVQLRSEKSDLDYMCRSVQGFKVLIHSAAEVPLIGQQFIRVPGSQDVVAVVKPAMVNTSDGLYDYHPHRRQCYFPAERRLKFLRVYTQTNCELECLANATLRLCGCVSFFMPRDKGTAICGPGKRNCTQKANEKYLIEKGTEMKLKMKLNRRIQDRRGRKTLQCNCLASCISLEYNAETSQAQYNWWDDPAQKGNNSAHKDSGLVLSRISVFFKDLQFITIRRREVYGQTDFIATIGGLLNLFSGFSVLSLLEILYFLTLRLWSRLKKKKCQRSAFEDVTS